MKLKRNKFWFQHKYIVVRGHDEHHRLMQLWTVLSIWFLFWFVFFNNYYLIFCIFQWLYKNLKYKIRLRWRTSMERWIYYLNVLVTSIQFDSPDIFDAREYLIIWSSEPNILIIICYMNSSKFWFRNNTSKFKIIITIFTWNPCHNILQIPFYLSPSKRKFSIRMKIQNSHPISIFEISFIRTNYERIPSTSNIFLFSKIRINFKRIRNHIKFIF